MSKRIHIVSFDVPYPADYGGVIDVFTRVKWFSENGWEVVLHCFEYKRPKAKDLEKFAEVHYYSRPRNLKNWFSKIPFIVNTRINADLENILRETKDEVILEGLHCSHYVNLQSGKFYVRTHNIEHDYYENLAKDASGLKKIYYRSEAKKLKSYEANLSKAKGLLVISEKELSHFKKINQNAYLVPSIIENKFDYSKTEPFVLFQGNLSIEENEEAVLWILKEIVPQLPEIKFVFAGKNPSEVLTQKSREKHVQLAPNPSEVEMEQLLQKARIHLLWTKNDSGLKLKFLKAMATSGHVLVNEKITQGSNLKMGFHSFISAEDATNKIKELMTSEYDYHDWQQRQSDLSAMSGNHKLKDIFG